MPPDPREGKEVYIRGRCTPSFKKRLYDYLKTDPELKEAIVVRRAVEQFLEREEKKLAATAATEAQAVTARAVRGRAKT